MISCSLGQITNAIIRKSLSGFTFCEFSVPVSSYSDSEKFELTIDGLKLEYKMASSDVYMQDGGKTVIKVSGILDKQSNLMELKPSAVESANISDVLESIGISKGPKLKTSFVNLFLTNAQLAIVLANMSPKAAFVDFNGKSVLYYADLYKEKPVKVQSAFRRMYSRAPIAGFIGWDSNTSASYPYDTQTVLPFGNFTNIDKTQMENLVNNCNELSKIFSDMQIFTASHTMELGSTVMSNLSYDKKIIVAAEEHYDINDCVTAVYYCV